MYNPGEVYVPHVLNLCSKKEIVMNDVLLPYLVSGSVAVTVVVLVGILGMKLLIRIVAVAICLLGIFLVTSGNMPEGFLGTIFVAQIGLVAGGVLISYLGGSKWMDESNLYAAFDFVLRVLFPVGYFLAIATTYFM